MYMYTRQKMKSDSLSIDTTINGKRTKFSCLAFLVSQRPTYVEVGPLMTTRFGEVR